ncbi:MAG TPA: NAD(P)/FAD-dependent oxidoreductase [Bacteroidota bacterium]|nr:NAD(P)/FAD-dependent oxidoreductase [Bacteroidota bacterium]
MESDFEIVIIGAGVVGLAIAARLSARHPRIAVIERNSRYGMETSSRNSEVIHAGIYYQPGSLKARLCVEGREELYRLCDEHRLPYKQIGKLIVARTPDELKALEAILKNGITNGAHLSMLDESETTRLEPNIAACGSIFSPRTGILSAHALMDYFFHSAVNRGALVQCNCEVKGIEKKGDLYVLELLDGGSVARFSAERVVNAAGLGADAIASACGIDISAAGYRIKYCKGSYFSVAMKKETRLSRLVYPVPTNESLGLHALLDLGGRLRFGPDVEDLPRNVQDYSVDGSKSDRFLKGIRAILPGVLPEEIAPDMSGIRPRLSVDGGVARDFIIVDEEARGLPGLINLIGIESPGLTASPAIARYVESLLD